MLHNGATAEIINGESFITYGIIIFEMVYCQLELCHNIILKKKTMFSSLYFWYGLVQSEVQKYWAPGCLEDYVLFSGT